MTIAIIGTGNVGTGLARAFAATPHDVVVAGTSTAKAEALAATLAEHGLTVTPLTLAEAVAAAHIIFLAIPFAAVSDVAGAADFRGKTVVDVTNPLTADFSGLTLGFDTSAAEEIAATLSGARVVKGFNTVFAQVYAEGADFGGRKVPVFLASDNSDAKAAVAELARDAGFEAVDAGALANARYIEPLAYLNIQFAYMLGRGTQIAPAWLSR